MPFKLPKYRRTVAPRRAGEPLHMRDDVTMSLAGPVRPATDAEFVLASGEALRLFREAFERWSDLNCRQAERFRVGNYRKLDGIDEAADKWKDLHDLVVYVARAHFEQPPDERAVGKLRELATAAAKRRKKPRHAAPGTVDTAQEATEQFLQAHGRLEGLRVRKGDGLAAGRKPSRALRKALGAAGRDLMLAFAEVRRHADDLFGPIVIVDLGRQTEMRVKALAKARRRR